MSGLFGGSHTTTKADKIAAFQSTTCDFGTPLPIIYGTAKRSPNLINFQDFEAKEIKTRTKTGKNSSTTSISYDYYVYVELALCEGVLGTGAINRIWIGDQEYESLAALNANLENEGAVLAFNRGNDANPTTYMQTNHPEIAVGYSNMAYLYGRIFLGSDGASMPSYSFEINGQKRLTGDGVDANPADVIIDLMKQIGLDQYADDTSFDNYQSYCRGAGLYISTPEDAFRDQKKCQECIKELLAITNAYMFWSVDRFKIVPRDDRARGSWQPNTTVCYDLTPNEMGKQDGGACVLYERKDSSEIYNRFGVTFTNRDNNYESETIFYEDAGDIALHGARTASDFSAKWLHTTERAVKVAEMQARINRTEYIKYKFKLPWQFALLEPGDLVTLTDPVVGLDHQLVMIDSIQEENDKLLTVTALRREATAVTPEYNIPAHSYNIMRYDADPGNVRAPIMIIPPAELVTAASGLELWIALQGQNKDWGGCRVYGSTKDGSYQMFGKHNKTSNCGYTLTAMTASSTSVDVHFTNPADAVEILEGSPADAANCLTDIWINGECMAYTDSELIGVKEYRLKGLQRGRYGTTAAAHSSNTSFAMLDGDLFCAQLTKNLKGKTLYLKFPSFNTFNKKQQSVGALDYYNHIVRLYDIPNVSNLKATVVRQEHQQTDYDPEYGYGATTTTYTWDVTVRWKAPDWDDYNGARVSYKRQAEPGAQGAAAGPFPWVYAGMGQSSLLIEDIAVAATYVIAVATKDTNGNYETADDSSQVTVTLSVPNN